MSSNEQELDIYKFYWGKNFSFSNEILSRYYLSLKTKPFIILTGISGTGKTKIAQIFADYMCQNDSTDDKKKRIAFIPVRPDWMDNQGLLGYYNVLQEKYIKTPLLNLLLEAIDNPKKPYFVILDEMNLAKVEYYFSDFLSIMESRTQDNPNGETIPLYDKDQGDGHKDKVPYEIHIPNNVYFTGTVNIDESTYMFSPKVLDRANVIEFNQVTLDSKKQERDIDENKFLLSDSEVIDSLYSEKQPFIKFVDLKDDHLLCSDAIVDLLMIMEKDNMHFGYRVADEMARFIILSKKNINKFDWKDTLDIQILQKILPKLHGTRAKLENPIKELIVFCEKKKFLRSAKKLKSMQKNLDHNGYASFIE